MTSIRSLLSSLAINVVVACLTVGVALGVTNVLVNHVHWFGAYLISCSNRDWRGEPFIPPRARTRTLSESLADMK
jgi:hypothetical protein